MWKGRKGKEGTDWTADLLSTEFDEDDEGFQFTRVTTKKPRSSIEGPKLNPVMEDQTPQQSPKRGRPRKKRLDVGNDGAEDTNRTPDVVVRKSTRTTRNAAPAEVETQAGSTSRSTRKHDQTEAPPTQQHDHPEPAPTEKKRKKGRPAKPKPEERNGFVSPEPVQTSTATISLPMADTPVIQRNKEMRTKKSEKGNRRSSLGMRGRRASSLIDSGTSNGGYISWFDTTVLMIYSIAAQGGRHGGFLQTYCQRFTRTTKNAAAFNLVRNSSNG